MSQPQSPPVRLANSPISELLTLPSENVPFRLSTASNPPLTLSNAIDSLSQVTGWLKKEADKGLKVGSLIKKPFHDRWFVLDMAESKLSYYEKKDSDNVKGVINLAKVTKLAKTGKTPTEFMIEILDDATGPKVITLQAPAVAQTELWIKAIGIVKEAAKRKAASKQEPSNSAQSTSAPSASPSTTSPSTTSSAPSSTPKTPIETPFVAEIAKPTPPEPSTASSTTTVAETPSKVETPPSPRKSSPSTFKSTSQPKVAATTPPAATSNVTTSVAKVSSPISPRPSGPKSGGSFLASQRASMHPAIASPAKSTSPSQVSALASQFEAPAKTNGPARWSSALTPSASSNASPFTASTSTNTSQAAPSSMPAPSSPPVTPTASTASEAPSSASMPKTSNKPRTASIPSSSPSNGSEKVVAPQPPQEASLPPVEPKPKSIPSVTQLASSAELKSSSPAPSETEMAAPQEPETPLPVIEDTFKLGDKEVFVRSSLSSQAPQPVGQMLLSDSASLETSLPLVRSSNGVSSSTEQLRASDSVRQRPAVPSPMSILEQEINRSYDQETHTPPPIKERENVISAQTPDALMVLLRHARIHPDREVLIQLGERVLLGLNGTWVAQDTYYRDDNLRDLEADFDPETGYTWYLPGFLQVRWYRHNTWSITSREASPSDEIKWNLLGVGKLLEDFNKFLSVPRQALVYHLYSSVHKIMEETTDVRESYDFPLEQQGEKLLTPAIELLVRRDLCTRLAAVLLDGFNDWSIFRKYHIYDFIHEAGLDRTNVHGFGALQLPLVIADVEDSSDDSNVRFRNFVVAALNQRLLYTWMAHMFKNQPQVSDYYEDESLVRQVPLVVLNALAPLSSLAFHIPLETAAKR